MSDNLNNNFLTVNNKLRKRPMTPENCSLTADMRAPSPAVSFDESLLSLNSGDMATEDMKRAKATSLLNLSLTDSNESLRKHNKSIENLCFLRKKQHRRAQINEEIYRPRCNTEPISKEETNFPRPLTIPILRIPEDDISLCNDSNADFSRPFTPNIERSPSPTLLSSERKCMGSSGALGSLLKQTIKVTTASMGFRAASMERLATSTFRPLSENDKQRFSRSTSSVSTLAQLSTDSALPPMAPLQTHAECQSVQCLNNLDKDYKSLSSASNVITGASSSSPTQQQAKRALQNQLSIPESLQTTSIGCVTSSEFSSARSLKHSETSLTPLQTVNSASNLRSISPSRRSASSNSSSTAKHEQQSTAAATAAAAANATTSNNHNVPTTAIATASTPAPPEKEKKRKEVSSSRVKKFHRHFSQVPKDEQLINYFSCALVSDILLQGHLYITEQHFAFYSNVFGYVTKVVIPTSSVTKISKEKTAKIIPNAVGVATADERHVFGSFISREAAFRLMCSVCPPMGAPEILPKDPANVEVSEEYSIEDESSCSISGNESPAQNTNNNKNNNCKSYNVNSIATSNQTLLRRKVGTPNLLNAETTAADNKLRHSDIPINAKQATNATSSRVSAPQPSCSTATGAMATSAASHCINDSGGGGVAATNSIGLAPTQEEVEGTNSKLSIIAGCASTTTSATSTPTPTPSTSSIPTTVMTLPSTKAKQLINTFRSVSNKLMLHMKFPTEIHVVYLGVTLTLLLALFSIFLLYRILDIEAKTNSYRSHVQFNWHSGNDDDIFSEALRLQRQLQLKSTEEAQNILKMNLEQIAKVRRSLETLSMLIHDRSSSFVSTHTDDSD